MKNSRFAMATHIMAALGVDHRDGNGGLKNSIGLAKSVNTNPVVIRRLLSDLQRAGLVQTQAGKNGGARLARDPKSITLEDVFAAVDDGELFAFNPNDPNHHCPLSCLMKSVLAPIFSSAQKAMNKELKKVRLSQLVEKLDRDKCSPSRSGRRKGIDGLK
jgi:Rrf2 family protein